MRDAGRMVAALRAALFTRLDLLCEILALRHQQGVLARSDRRFRPADRLLWLCLQRFGLDGEMRWCLSSPPRLTAGGAQGFGDAGGGAHGGGREDHASILNFKPSFAACVQTTFSGALRGSTVSC